MVGDGRPGGLAVVSRYHDEVDAAVTAMSSSLDAGEDNSAALAALDGALQGPTAREVIDRLPHTRAELLAAARRELEDPKMRLPSSPKSRAALVRILVLHQVDAMWWAHSTPYADQEAVEDAPELVSLPVLDRAGALRFRFAVQPEGLVGRGRDAALRRMAPRRRPQVSGMKFLVARPEIVTLLNEVGDIFRKEAPAGTPALWVNSIVRSVEHQQHLSARAARWRRGCPPSELHVLVAHRLGAGQGRPHRAAHPKRRRRPPYCRRLPPGPWRRSDVGRPGAAGRRHR